MSVCTQASTTGARYLSLPQGHGRPIWRKARHVTFTGNGNALCSILLQQRKILGQLFGGFNSTWWILPWKSLVSLNELHPSLLSFYLCHLYGHDCCSFCLVPPPPTFLFFSSCTNSPLIPAVWPGHEGMCISPRKQIVCFLAAPQTQLHAEL